MCQLTKGYNMSNLLEEITEMSLVLRDTTFKNILRDYQIYKIKGNSYHIYQRQGQRHKPKVYLKPGYYIGFHIPYGQEFDVQILKCYLPVMGVTYKGDYTWMCPLEPWVAKVLSYYLEEVIEIKELLDYKAINTDVNTNPVLSGFPHPPMPHQIKILKKIFNMLKNGEKGLLAVDAPVGSGKTLVAMALTFLKFLEKDGTIRPPSFLYITKKSLIGQVKHQFGTHALYVPDVYNYEAYKHFVEKNYDIVCFDEALKCANPNTITLAIPATSVARKAQVVLAMTGTCFSAQKLGQTPWIRLAGGHVPREKPNIQWLFGAELEYKDWSKKNEEKRRTEIKVKKWNMEKFAKMVPDNFMYISEEMAALSLPEKQYEILWAEPNPKIKKIAQGIYTQRGNEKIVKQVQMATQRFIRRDSGKPKDTKYTGKDKIIVDFVDANSNVPIVIATSNPIYLEHLVQKVLKKYNPAFVSSTIGNTLSEFQNGKTDVIVISANMAEGFNLQRSSIMLIAGNSFSPAMRLQLEGRIYRKGQTKRCIFFDIVTKSSLDYNLIQSLKKYKEETEEYIKAMLARELGKLC